MSSDQHKKSGRKDGLERKIDALSASVDQRFDTLSASVDLRFDTLSASVDLRFDEVARGFVEQRQYTEFAFDRLTVEMRSGFSELRGGFSELRGDVNELRGDVNELRGGFNRIERKLDQFIDMQSKTNELVERRLNALESTRQPSV